MQNIKSILGVRLGHNTNFANVVNGIVFYIHRYCRTRC